MNKRILRITMAVCLIIATFFPSIASAQRGEKSVGLLGGYTTANHSAVAGLYFQYRFSKHFRLSPEAEYIFRHDDIDGFIVNLNAQVPFDFYDQKMSLYPLAGINYTTWSRHSPVSDDGQDLSERKKRFGLNIGGGIEYRATSSLRLFAEGRYSLVRSFESGVFSVGIGYVF